MGLECISVNPTDEGVTVGTTFLNEGRMEERNFHCSILVASDGARSTVRKLVGIEMKGVRDLQKLVSVHFLSRNLVQYLLHRRPGMLFFIFNPEAIRVLVAHDLNEGEFVLQIPYYPPQQRFEDFSFKMLLRNLFHTITESYLLAMLLIDSRQRVVLIAISNTALSVKNFKAAMSVPAALGLDPTVTNAVHQVVNTSLGSILPSTFQKAVLGGIFFSIGRAQLSDFVLNENSPLGSSRLARLRTIFDEGKRLRLQFPAEDFGFRYLEGALVADRVKKTQKAVETDSRDYVPSSKPGTRLPHMQLRMLIAWSSEDVFSTLDLVPTDKLEFVLIIAPLKDSNARVAFKVAETFKVSLTVCVIWPQGSVPTDDDSVSGKELEHWKNYIDVEEVRN